MTSVKILVLCATVIQISSGKLTRVYHNSTFLDHASAVQFSWTYEQSQDMLFMALEVNATGWIGVGFAKKIFKMQGYDVVIGKVENGRGTLMDRHTVGYREPLADLQQDYKMTYHEEVNGITRLEFHRKRVTGDSKDLDIELGPMLLVYAYHSTLDYPSPYKTKHDHKGYKTVVLLPWDTNIPRNISSTIAPRTSTALGAPSFDKSTSQRLSIIPLTSTVGILGTPVAFSMQEQQTSTRTLPSSLSLTSRFPATTSLLVMPSMSSSSMPSSSVVTSSLIPSPTSSLSSLYSSVHSKIGPVFVVPDDVYDKYVKVSFRTKITNVQYEVIRDRTTSAFLKFKNELEKHFEKKRNVWKAVLTNIRQGSVIADYDVYMNTSSVQETRQVIDDIQQDVKRGRLGNFVVDPGYSSDPVITMKARLEEVPTSSTIRTAEPRDNLILVILLGCTVGLVFILLIVIIVLAMRIKKGNHRSSSYSLKPVGAYECDVNY